MATLVFNVTPGSTSGIDMSQLFSHDFISWTPVLNQADKIGIASGNRLDYYLGSNLTLDANGNASGTVTGWQATDRSTGFVFATLSGFSISAASVSNAIRTQTEPALLAQIMAGADVITGSAGADVLDGLGGVDNMAGGLGHDTYRVDSASDKVTEAAGAGTDIVRSTASSYTLSANVENGAIDSLGTASMVGNTLDNTIFAGQGNNVIDGVSGNDTVSYANMATPVVVSLATSGAQDTQGAGTDTLRNIDNLTGTGYWDTLTGNANANVLDGGAGGDTLRGGDGNDTYGVDVFSDQVIESNAGSTGGIDLVKTSMADYTLPDNVENGRLMSSGSANLTGNGLANVLFAGLGNNTLDGAAGTDLADYSYAKSAVTVNLRLTTPQATGGSGTDTLVSIEGLKGSAYNDSLIGTGSANRLDGGAGADRLNGGDGDDTYVVDNSGDVVTESNTTSTGGVDTVISILPSLTLGTAIENGQIGTSATASLIGNGVHNVLTAGAGNNVINGAGGTDTADYSTAGAAVTVSLAITTAQATGGSGSDTLVAIENLRGSSQNDVLTGNGGANQLDGHVGADRMTGGDGNDTYVVDNAGDVVVESSATGGADTVYSSLASYTLGANVEYGRITATGSANLTGNGLDNILAAGAGNNVLDGGAGIDKADYATATGPVTVNLGLTTAQATGGSGTDTLKSIENLLGSGANDTLIGSSAANTITGGTGSDRITGGGGADRFVLTSLAGVDTITDFVSGTDKLALNPSALPIGDGDATLEGATTRSAPGGFSAAAELVIFTANMPHQYTLDQAAAAIGSATAAYAAGTRVLFALDDGVGSALCLFTSSGNDAVVSAEELRILAVLDHTPSTTTADYLCGS